MYTHMYTMLMYTRGSNAVSPHKAAAQIRRTAAPAAALLRTGCRVGDRLSGWSGTTAQPTSRRSVHHSPCSKCGLSSKIMALITSGCSAMKSMGIKWP